MVTYGKKSKLFVMFNYHVMKTYALLN